MDTVPTQPDPAHHDAVRAEAASIARNDAFWEHFDLNPASTTRWVDSARAAHATGAQDAAADAPTGEASAS
ncbi:hypothetical protein ACDF64_07640 [Agromyces sp. MMS24-JH15]|uniref:hypothetical protein n=1 Tax=Agromyces sp. MMS24-JH15 TaxID=3243765 RepID=UPI003748B279